MATQSLTNEQAKRAAYKYCELLGLDPEQPVPAASPTSYIEGVGVVSHLVHKTQSLWQSVATRIVEADRIHQAIQFAREVTDGNAVG